MRLGRSHGILLRMIAGLEEITSGEIAIGGQVVNAVPPKQRDIAMVFQNYALYPHMKVYDNMAFTGPVLPLRTEMGARPAGDLLRVFKL